MRSNYRNPILRYRLFCPSHSGEQTHEWFTNILKWYLVPFALRTALKYRRSDVFTLAFRGPERLGKRSLKYHEPAARTSTRTRSQQCHILQGFITVLNGYLILVSLCGHYLKVAYLRTSSILDGLVIHGPGPSTVPLVVCHLAVLLKTDL